MTDQPEVSIVLMAKAAVPGEVKTRLAKHLSPNGACAVHVAMMQCVLARMIRHFPPASGFSHALAVPGGPSTELGIQTPEGWGIIDQGSGDLGDRLAHVWQHLGGGRVAFFGVDSPDLPTGQMGEIKTGFADANVDAMVGPTFDGGYWTLAAKCFDRRLLTGIDWGTSSVYDQTIEAGQNAQLRMGTLGQWHDVDEIEDLRSLSSRLAEQSEPALVELHERIASALKEYSS